VNYFTFLFFFIYLFCYFYDNLGITQVAEAMVSIKRLQKFLMYDELTPPEIGVKEDSNENNKENTKENNEEDMKKNNKKNANKDLIEQKNDYTIVDQPNYVEHSISIENGSAKWLDYEQENTLQNITMKVRPGELVAIVGQVGAGKSSLLNVILKELRLQEGSIQVC